MAIVGFNYLSIAATRGDERTAKIKISSNVSIKSIEKKDFSLGDSKQSALRFLFDFVAKYEPNVGSINLAGEVIYLDNAGKNKEILDSWTKNKIVPEPVMKSILNTILEKCNLQAIVLSNSVNLPPPIPMRFHVGKEAAAGKPAEVKSAG